MRRHPHSSINTRIPNPKGMKDRKSAMGELSGLIHSNFIASVLAFEMRKENSKRLKNNRHFRAA